MSDLPPGWITISDYVALAYPAPKGSISLRLRILAAYLAAAALIAMPIAIIYLAFGLMFP